MDGDSEGADPPHFGKIEAFSSAQVVNDLDTRKNGSHRRELHRHGRRQLHSRAGATLQ